MQFDLRNGSIRKKYDSLKYTLRKLENTLYELSLAEAGYKRQEDADRVCATWHSSRLQAMMHMQRQCLYDEPAVCRMTDIPYTLQLMHEISRDAPHDLCRCTIWILMNMRIMKLSELRMHCRS